jgi:hypothetical protein
MAVLEAYTWLRQQADGIMWRRATIISDCLILVQTIQTGTTKYFPSWRAVDTLYQIKEAAQAIELEIDIVHAYREELTAPHNLAN